jgi:hypothetical protein
VPAWPASPTVRSAVHEFVRLRVEPAASPHGQPGDEQTGEDPGCVFVPGTLTGADDNGWSPGGARRTRRRERSAGAGGCVTGHRPPPQCRMPAAELPLRAPNGAHPRSLPAPAMIGGS